MNCGRRKTLTVYFITGKGTRGMAEVTADGSCDIETTRRRRVRRRRRSRVKRRRGKKKINGKGWHEKVKLEEHRRKKLVKRKREIGTGKKEEEAQVP